VSVVKSLFVTCFVHLKDSQFRLMLSFIELIEQFWTNLQQGQLPQLGSWNYLLLASLIIWQGPVATLLGGAAASAGLLRPGLVFIVAICTNLSADVLWYTIGRRGNVDRLFKKRWSLQ
jgi:membrane protein DedA with SNARE-associated domain